MYNNFDDFYNETYNNFYNACEFKDLISSEPIPHKIDETINSAGKYENGVVYIKPSSLKSDDEIKRMCSLLYHELTHYYDDVMFHHIGYSEDDINNVLLLTYSEIHAAYNGMFAFLNLKNLSINKKININKIVFEAQTLQILKLLLNSITPLMILDSYVLHP